MKKLKIALVLLAIGFTSLVTAQSTNKIGEKLKNIPFPVEEEVTAKAFIKFDKTNKIIDVRVASKNYQINNFIETRLIRSRFKVENFEAFKTYVLPIKVLSLTK